MSKNQFDWLRVSVLVGIFLVIPFFPAFWKPLLVLGIFAFALIAWNRCDLAVCAFLALSPFMHLVTIPNSDSVFLGSWRELLFVLLLMMFIMRRRNGFTILLRSGKALTLLLIIFGWYFIIQAMRTPLPIVGILGIRENYRFLLLFPLIIALSQEYESFPKAAFKWMVLGGISISILHLLFYITHWEPPLLYDKATILIPGAHRIILGFEGTRMLSLVGGGPSGLPATVVPLACASIACAFYKKEKRIAWVLAAAIIFLTSFLTFSGTWIAATAFGLVCMLVLQKYCLLDRKGAQGRFFILKICGLILVFVFLFGRTILRPEGPVSLFYLSKYYITTSTDWFGRLPTKSLIDLFFGHELATGGGAPLLAGKTYISTSIGLVDMGWMSIVYQVGILGFSIIFMWTLGVIITAWRTLKSVKRFLPNEYKQEARLVVIMTVGFFSCLASYHTTPWTRMTGLDAYFPAFAGLIVGISEKIKRSASVSY